MDEIEGDTVDLKEKKAELRNSSKATNVDIFISYNWDYQDLVKALRDELVSRNMTVWMDVDFMGAGQHLYREIAKALHKSRIAICVVSKKYLQSPNCALEVNYAFDLKKQGKLEIIPVVIEDLQLTEDPGDIGFLLAGMLYMEFIGLNNHQKNWSSHPNYKGLLQQLAMFIAQAQKMQSKEDSVDCIEVQYIEEKADTMKLLEAENDPLPDGMDELFQKFDISQEAINSMRRDELLDVDLLRDLPEPDIERYGATRGMQLKLRKLLKYLKNFQDQPMRAPDLMADKPILSDARLLELSSKLIKESHTLCALLGLSNDTYDALITDDKITNGLTGVNMELFQRWFKKKDADAKKSVSVAKKMKKMMTLLRREDLAKTVEGWIVQSMDGKPYVADDDSVYQGDEDEESNGEILTDFRLRTIAKKVGPTEMNLGMELGLEYSDIQSHIANEKRVEDRVFMMLHEWNRAQSGTEAQKKQTLINIFQDLRRKDIASIMEAWNTPKSI